MKVTIAGATGVLGRHVVPRLLERGHEVRAIVRKKEHAVVLEGEGARTFGGDILVPEGLHAATEDADCILHLATAIPKDRLRGDWSMNDRIRRQGTLNLLRAAKDGGVLRYVQQSIIMLYGHYGSRIVDESAALQPAPRIQSAFDMEEYVRSSGLQWCILRGGHFYGPSTGAEDAWREMALSRRLTVPGDGTALISLIHAVDMARAIVAATEKAKSETLYNVVDDHPAKYSELFGFVARQMGALEPRADGSEIASLGCSNLRIKADLAWEPLFPSFYSGLA